MEFDHRKHGFKIRNITAGSKETTCELVLKLNNVEKTGKDEVRIIDGLPVEDVKSLLKDLKKSIDSVLRECDLYAAERS